ncbi:hypothetical protein [Luteolibacter marinus]|uniref:hypothetical protein n=1 Tax=Luteolibacter marinus TaxID=2776705 RepID=UPI00186819BB|nr:hypothetical protein [Luteolibacter marinus]
MKHLHPLPQPFALFPLSAWRSNRTKRLPGPVTPPTSGRRFVLPLLPFVLAAGSLVAPAGADTVMLENDFGEGADTGPGFQTLWNGSGGAANTDDLTFPASGVVTITSGASDNAAIGLNTSAAVDASGNPSFTLIWVVSNFSKGQTGSGYIHYNGWFFGATTSTSSAGNGLWNNAARSIGILLDGGTNYNDWRFVQRTPGGNVTQTALNGNQASVQSFADGFTLTLTVNDDDTWSASSTGLSNEINATGGLAAGTYAAMAGSLVANTSIQGRNLSYTVDEVILGFGIEPPVPAVPEIVAITRSGSTVTIDFTGGVDGGTYRLNKSTSLDFSTPDIKDSITLSGTTGGTLQDFTATGERAFYRIEQE